MPGVLINAPPGIRPVTRKWLMAQLHAMKLWSTAACAALLTAFTMIGPGNAQVELRYPPLGEYLMPRDTEIALARSAAPTNVSGRATVKVLTESGFQVATDGENGFVCLVMRGWSAPTYTPAQFRDLVYDASVRAPICFDPTASRTVLPYYELRSRLGMEGKDPEQIAERVEAAYAAGELPRRDTVSFAYMWSADQHLGPGIGHWHPHMMVFAPYFENATVGGNDFGSPLPQVSDDADTPFTVVVIPVDQRLAVKAVMTADQDGIPAATFDDQPGDALETGAPHDAHRRDGS